MPQITLAEALRFLFPGIVIYIFLFVWESAAVKKLPLLLHNPSFLLAMVLISIVIYFLYRIAIYNPLITRIHDVTRKKRHNHRTYLKDRFNDLSHQEIIDMFTDLRDEHFSGKYKKMEVQASCVHFLYITSVAAIGFIILAIIFGSNQTLFVVYGGAAFSAFFLGALLDKNYENREYGFMKNLPDSSLRTAYEKIIDQRRS